MDHFLNAYLFVVLFSFVYTFMDYQAFKFSYIYTVATVLLVSALYVCLRLAEFFEVCKFDEVLQEMKKFKKMIFIINVLLIPCCFVIFSMFFLSLVCLASYSKNNREQLRFQMVLFSVDVKNVKLFKFIECTGEDINDLVAYFSLLRSSQDKIDFCLKNMRDISNENVDKVIKYVFGFNRISRRNVPCYVEMYKRHSSAVRIEKILRNISPDYCSIVFQMYPQDFPLYNFVVGVYVSKIRKSKNFLSKFPIDLVRMVKKFIVY